MCPLTCNTVKDAIKAHDERGVVIHEYLDDFKRFNTKCQMCMRNEYSTLPDNFKVFDGVDKESEDK